MSSTGSSNNTSSSPPSDHRSTAAVPSSDTSLEWPPDPIPDGGDGKSYSKTIPRYIWHTAPSLPLSDRANATVSTWIDKNPSWKHSIATDDDVELFFQSKFPPNVYEAFSKLPLGVMKADTFRLAVVYYYGGVYGDIDTECVRPIDEWVRVAQSEKQCTAIVAMESYNSFANWAFAAAPRHPVFKRALDRVVEKIEQDGGVVPKNSHFVAAYTGPPVLTAAIRDILHSDHEVASKIMSSEEDLATAKTVGLCLEESSYFGGINVGHAFASVSWNDNDQDASWRKQRQQVLDSHGIAEEEPDGGRPMIKKGGRPNVHVVGGGGEAMRVDVK
eukprot:CAMPEP_0181030836 /NCGR_PEP_ID=MMETSP1070-20121207/5927_1 /TAXON_ID=265543 /ORGANISM="Minutocellus polymorphus, Strain NH13" /LENGTH=329 /DNA_ID=CAMNT_0023108205 /DNA_START=148 /DNA_END=1137 /DNA_ORIENTATION=+